MGLMSHKTKPRFGQNCRRLVKTFILTPLLRKVYNNITFSSSLSPPFVQTFIEYTPLQLYTMRVTCNLPCSIIRHCYVRFSVLNALLCYEDVCRHGVVFHSYFELLTKVLLYVQVLWCVAPCRLVAI